jgi:hypothetical protein
MRPSGPSLFALWTRSRLLQVVVHLEVNNIQRRVDSALAVWFESNRGGKNSCTQGLALKEPTTVRMSPLIAA